MQEAFMSKERMLEARQLIQQKRYDEARKILKTVDHPTAREWMRKLDADAPRKTPLWIPLFSLVSIAVIIILSVTIIRLQQQLNSISAQVTTHDSTIQELDSHVQILDTDLDGAIRVVNSHASDINALASDISSLASNLSVVAAVADNADRYAHSHDFSDMTLKVGISEIDSPLERILTLHGISFTWDGSAYPELSLESGRDYGVLAQEVAQVFPELVITDPDPGLLMVDYQGLIPIMIEAVREQQLQIDALRTVVGSG
jgi:uncharacterized protein YoxC